MHVAWSAIMRSLCILILIGAASTAQAQNGVRPPQGWSLSFGAGGSAYTAMHRSADDARLSAHTSGVFFAALSWWPNRNWGVRLFGADRPTRFSEITVPDTIAADTITYASLSIQSLQLQANFRMPTIHNRIMPYGILGGGVTRFASRGRGNPIPIEARSDFSRGPLRVRSGAVGIGARLQTRRNAWALNFELLDQIARTPIQSAGENQVHTTSAASFTVGLSWMPYPH